MFIQHHTLASKSLHLFAMISVAALIALSSLSAHANTLISSTNYLEYELPKTVQESCYAKSNCPDIEVKYLETNYDWMNEIVNARINNLIINSAPSESSPSQSNSQKEAKQAIDDFTISQFVDMPDHVSWAYNLMVTPDYLGHVDNFELFEINTYTFMGGAHGSSFSEYLIFDLNTKKQVKLADMLQAGKKPRFEALVYDAYKAWVKTMDEDVASYEKNWPFELSDNVTLTDKGINIRYQQYAIAPYAYGMPELNISYNKLRGIIKTKYMMR